MDLSPNLAGYWPFAVDGNDYSGNGRHFTAVGTPVHATVDGFPCAQNLGAANYYTNPSVGWLANRIVLSITGWFRRSASDAAALHAALTFGGIASQATVMYPINQNITTGYREFCNNTITHAPNDNAPTAGGWRFIARILTLNPIGPIPTCTVYRDSLDPIVYTATSCATPVSMTALRVGNYYNGGVQAYDGDVRELRIWVDRALTANEVADVRNGVFESGRRRRGRRLLFLVNKGR